MSANPKTRNDRKETKPTTKRKMKTLLALVLVILAVAAQLQAGTLVGGYNCSTSKEVLEKAIRYSEVDHDRAAFEQLNKTGLLLTTKEGAQVELVEGGLLAGLYKVRIRGTMAELWIPREAYRSN